MKAVLRAVVHGKVKDGEHHRPQHQAPHKVQVVLDNRPGNFPHVQRQHHHREDADAEQQQYRMQLRQHLRCDGVAHRMRQPELHQRLLGGNVHHRGGVVHALHVAVQPATQARDGNVLHHDGLRRLTAVKKVVVRTRQLLGINRLRRPVTRQHSGSMIHKGRAGVVSLCRQEGFQSRCRLAAHHERGAGTITPVDAAQRARVFKYQRRDVL